jgi:hypothetical protein
MKSQEIAADQSYYNKIKEGAMKHKLRILFENFQEYPLNTYNLLDSLIGYRISLADSGSEAKQYPESLRSLSFYKNI